MTSQIADLEISPGQALLRDVRRFLSRRRVTGDQARFLASSYLTIQRYRIGMQARARAQRTAGQDSLTIELFGSALQEVEEAMVPVLGRWARSLPQGRWLLSIRGIGPIVAAGLVAYATPDLCDRPQRLWAYAGLTPDNRQDYSRALRRFVYYAVEGFIRHGGFYRRLYVQRKAYEWRQNIAGRYADQARAKLRYSLGDGARAFAEGNVDPEKLLGALAAGKPPIAANGALNPAIRRLSSTPVPMLTPGHIDRRARRWTSKLFLSHYAEVTWEATRRPDDPPWTGPYVLTHLKHRDKIAPPNWPIARDWNELTHPVPELYPELSLGALIAILDRTAGDRTSNHRVKDYPPEPS